MINRRKLYDLIYDKADKLLKQYNPCNIRIEKEIEWLFGKLICNNEDMCEEYGECLCCGGCTYLKQSGCSTKCLGCKVGMCWFGHSCKDVSENDLLHINISQIFIHKIDRLRKIALKYQLNKIRISKEKLFDGLLF